MSVSDFPSRPVEAPDLSDVRHDPADRRRSRSGRDGRGRRPRRSRRVVIVRVVLALVVALVVYLGYLAVSSLIIAREAKGALAAARQAQSALAGGDIRHLDTSRLGQALDALSDGIHGIHRQTSSPGWGALEYVPVVGKDVRAVRQAVAAADDVADNGLPQVRNALKAVHVADFGLHGGTVSLPGLADAATPLSLAAPVFQRADAQMEDIAPGSLGPVTQGLDQAKDVMSAADSAVGALSRLAFAAPTMLDLSGGSSRTYLVLAENNAELRATGGLPGSWGVVTVSGGTLSLQGFEPETSLPILDSPALPLTPEETNLFSDRMGRYPHDVNLTPDFPRAAAAAKAIWESANPGTPVDGVIALDPVLLQDLLAVTGGAVMDDGTTLDGTNAATVLLHDVYARSDDANWQNAFFSSAARVCFDRILSGGGDTTALFRALWTSVEGGHLKVWSAHEDEQSQLEGSALGGALPQEPARPTVGVYFNDYGQSKMDWYLDRHVASRRERADADGSVIWRITVTLANTLAPAAVPSTPAYVLGDQANGVAAGQIGVNVFHYMPAGGRLVDWSLPGGGGFGRIATHDGLTVAALQVTLDPGQTMSYSFRVQTAPVRQRPLSVVQTPTVPGGGEGKEEGNGE